MTERATSTPDTDSEFAIRMRTAVDQLNDMLDEAADRHISADIRTFGMSTFRDGPTLRWHLTVGLSKRIE